LAIMLIVLATMGLNRTVSGLLAGWIVGVLWAIFAVQIFLSIRRVYRQDWFMTVFKFFVGGFVYLIVLSVALAATFFITLARPRFSRMFRVTTAITRRGRQMENASYLRCVRMRSGTLASLTQVELTFAF